MVLRICVFTSWVDCGWRWKRRRVCLCVPILYVCVDFIRGCAYTGCAWVCVYTSQVMLGDGGREGERATAFRVNSVCVR